MRLLMFFRLLPTLVLLFCCGTAPAEEPSSEPRSVKVDLRTGGWDTVLAEVARRQGKVVLVDIWTTTCPICVEELPKFVKLQQEFGANRVVCLTVNCDYDGVKTKPPAFYRPQVIKRLAEQRPQVKHLMLNISLLDFLNQVDLGSTPAVYVFGENGKLLRRFDNDNVEQPADEFDIDDVREYVRTHLKQTQAQGKPK